MSLPGCVELLAIVVAVGCLACAAILAPRN